MLHFVEEKWGNYNPRTGLYMKYGVMRNGSTRIIGHSFVKGGPLIKKRKKKG